MRSAFNPNDFIAFQNTASGVVITQYLNSVLDSEPTHISRLELRGDSLEALKAYDHLANDIPTNAWLFTKIQTRLGLQDFKTELDLLNLPYTWSGK